MGVVEAAGTANPGLLYVHADHLSRPIRLTDAGKVTAWAVEWLPWGGVHAITGSETLNARFPGQWFQVESGLHYNWHRHYDPTIGRYTQPDPLGFVDGPSVYAYARNAPGEVVDPTGLMAPWIPGYLRKQNEPQAEPSSRVQQCTVALKDTCQKCLNACDGGAAAIERFCRSTPMPPPAKALCWAVVHQGRNVCRGYCYTNHCADVPLEG